MFDSAGVAVGGAFDNASVLCNSDDDAATLNKSAIDSFNSRRSRERVFELRVCLVDRDLREEVGVETGDSRWLLEADVDSSDPTMGDRTMGSQSIESSNALEGRIGEAGGGDGGEGDDTGRSSSGRLRAWRPSSSDSCLASASAVSRALFSQCVSKWCVP